MESRQNSGTSASPGPVSRSRPALSYQGIVVDEQDIELLKSLDMVTDSVMDCFVSHLSRTIRNRYPEASISLLRPYLASLLASPTTSADSIRPALPTDAIRSTHLLLPVPNQGHTPPDTGPYWSLLVVSALDGLAFHYTVRPEPSGGGAGVTGDDAARKTSAKLSTMLRAKLRYRTVPVPTYTAPAGSDCGLAVCALLRYLLLRRLLAVRVNETISMGLGEVGLNLAGVKEGLVGVVMGSGWGGDDAVSCPDEGSESRIAELAGNGGEDGGRRKEMDGEGMIGERDGGGPDGAGGEAVTRRGSLRFSLSKLLWRR
ncbi:hypothetical protein MFIFM68171_08402 [Madurella fahalii]|uniref:Ubiquitin-like protease family profile domain-containing protein n=1 Tax=Madurella fahalii TaxID=1157608 RepID=A0ABQ0GKC9_9PEZI